jgi:hypothetical protein
MSIEATNVDETDTETLQAQIDLSLSFAQNLVSSWVKPSVKLSLSRRNNIEEELESYIRRPPRCITYFFLCFSYLWSPTSGRRLGVGATVPEATSASLDPGRLKNRLLNNGGKKRTREGDDNMVEQPIDDEEESRAGAIRKKAKKDPFGGMNGNKKLTANEATGLLTPRRSIKGTAPEEEPAESVVNNGPRKELPPQKDTSVSSPSQLITRKKNRKRKNQANSNGLPTPKPSVENARGRHFSPHSAATSFEAESSSPSGII